MKKNKENFYKNEKNGNSKPGGSNSTPITISLPTPKLR